MTKIAYFKCPTGIAGDMCLGALVDAGVPWEYLTSAIASLNINEEYQLEQKQVLRNSQKATKVLVHLQHHQGHHHARHLPEIEDIICSSLISDRSKKWSLAVFRKLAVAEGAVHGVSPQQVHFHEVGATDAIVDIVGTCVGLDWLGIDELYCSALPTGGGTVKAAHGILSVPVPAVLQLYQSRQVPLYNNGIEKELVTPTGAAIVTALAVSFGSPPEMSVQRVGLGAGSQDFAIANVLQLWIGEAASSYKNEEITVLETQIDDLSPQAVAYTLERLLEVGALDVFTQGITMKKSRSGILLTVICYSELAGCCKDIIFRETTTLGIRERVQPRSLLQRHIETVITPYGDIQVKIATDDNGEAINLQPEYEDCAAIARKHDLSWRTVHQAAILAATRQIK